MSFITLLLYLVITLYLPFYGFFFILTSDTDAKVGWVNFLYIPKVITWQRTGHETIFLETALGTLDNFLYQVEKKARKKDKAFNHR